jgi:hypothetical protein
LEGLDHRHRDPADLAGEHDDQQADEVATEQTV